MLFFADLLHHGYPAMEALHFLNIDTTKIEKSIENGESLLQILLKGQKGRFYEHLRFFIQIMSLSDAIESSHALVQFEKGIKTKLMKKSLYPLCILLFAYILLWFFSTTIIPQMMSSFSIDESLQTLTIFVIGIKILCTLFAYLTIAFLLLLGYLALHKRTRSRILYKIHSNISLIKDYESYLFSGYLMEMQKRGISTKNAMKYLSSIQEDSLFKCLIDEINKRLLCGEDLLEIIACTTLLNSTFITSFRIGVTTSKICELLSTYMKQQEFLWDKNIRKISIAIQCVSYAFVGIVVLIVYQIMLVPLSMLEQM